MLLSLLQTLRRVVDALALADTDRIDLSSAASLSRHDRSVDDIVESGVLRPMLENFCSASASSLSGIGSVIGFAAAC
jgi:hypothetical protein